MLLAALVRYAVTVHPEWGSARIEVDAGVGWGDEPAQPIGGALPGGGALLGGAAQSGGAALSGGAAVERWRRWRRCDPTDRRAVLLAAYRRVDVTPEGRLRSVLYQVHVRELTEVAS